MGDQRRIDGLDDLQLNLCLVDAVKQAHSFAKEDGRKRNMAFIDQTRIEILLDKVGAPGNANIATANNRTCLSQRAFNAIVDKVEGRPAWTHSRATYLMGHNKDGRVEGGFFRPELFAPGEHVFTHDADPGAVKRRLE